MRFAIVLVIYVAVCHGQDLASTAGQIFQNILPNLITNQIKNQNQGNSATSTFEQIGTVVGGVVDYSKKKSYEDLLRQVQDQTSDADLLQLSEELFNADVNNAFNYIQINLQGQTTPTSKNDEAQSK